MPRRLLFDIEANGLLPEVNRIHCIHAGDIDTGERLRYGPDDIDTGLAAMATADMLVAHNGLRYDWPALEKVKGFVWPFEKKHDTLVTSRLVFPAIKVTDGRLVELGILPGKLHGSHSIEAWGLRLKVAKLHPDLEDWSQWTPEIDERCGSDVTTGLALWKNLSPDTYSQEAIVLEHRVARLADLIETAGWPFDVSAAGDLHSALVEKQEVLLKRLVADFGFWFDAKESKKRKPLIALDVSGSPTKKMQTVVPWFEPKRDDAKRGYVKGQPCTKIEKVIFNPSSRDHIIRCLERLGWKPVAFTDNGKPKLDDEVLEQLSERFPQGGPLVEFLLLDKRIGALATGDKAWLKQVGADGCIHGSYNTMGTPHSRASHYRPNLAQVPAVKSPYGKECRALFTVKPGFVQVGADMQGLQLRNLAHYLEPFDGGAYRDLVLSGDPHWRTATILNLVSGEREKGNERHETIREGGSKRFMYAYVFGGQAAMLGSIIRDCCVLLKQKGLGDDLYDKFFGDGQSNKDVGNTAMFRFNNEMKLAKLNNKLAAIRADAPGRFANHIPGLDGRWVPVPSDRVALNYLLSSAEAILCKRWICDAHDALIARGFRWGWDGDFVFLGWIHDELQVAVREGREKEVGEVLTEAARKAGEPYGYRVRLDSSFKVGRTWACTH